MKKYKVYSWFSDKADMGYGCYPTIKVAEENKIDASQELNSDNLELVNELYTLEQLKAEHCFEILEYHGLE
jgi:hypothetical protein